MRSFGVQPRGPVPAVVRADTEEGFGTPLHTNGVGTAGQQAAHGGVAPRAIVVVFDGAQLARSLRRAERARDVNEVRVVVVGFPLDPDPGLAGIACNDPG